MFDIEIREAGEADLPVLAGLINETNQRCPGVEPVAAEGIATYAAAGLAAPERFLLVSLGAGEAPIGAIGVRRSGAWAVLSYVTVLQGMRRQGIGGMLVDEALDRCGAARALAVCWPVEAYLTFFASRGWRPIGEHAKYAWDLSALPATPSEDEPPAPGPVEPGFPLVGVQQGAAASGTAQFGARVMPGSAEGDVLSPAWPASLRALRVTLERLRAQGARRAGMWVYRGIDDPDPAAPIGLAGGRLARTWAVFARP